MKTLAIGSRVRLAPRIWGTVKTLDDHRAFIHWLRIRGAVERRYRMWFQILEIVPDAEPLTSDIPWRLRYWIQDGHGAKTPGLMSPQGDTPQHEYSPYSPLPP